MTIKYDSSKDNNIDSSIAPSPLEKQKKKV